MVAKDIRTSHELAAVLESAAQALRAFPELPLLELSQTLAQTQPHKKVAEKPGKSSTVEPSEDLSTRFSSLERSEAEAELGSLKVDAIRQLGTALGIRMPSKLTKSEATSMLLTQVFDIPAGQKLISTFHQRKAAR